MTDTTPTSDSLPRGANAADKLALALADEGASYAFGVPGGGPNLDVVGAFGAAGIRFVLAHAETSACIMAAIHGHLTNAPTAAVVTRGPGAAAAVNGAAQATLDRHPLVLVTDTVPTANRMRVPHQRIDQQAMLAPVTKHSAVLTNSTDQADVTALVRAALDGRPGAVHLDYDADAPATAPVMSSSPVPAADDPGHPNFEVARSQIRDASRPVVIVGTGALGAAHEIGQTLLGYGAPVLTTYQAIGAVPTESQLCAGLFTNGASERALLADADLIITVGLDAVEPIPALWDHAAPVIALTAFAETEPYIADPLEVTGVLSELVSALLVADHEWPADAGERYRNQVRAELGQAAPAESGRMTPVELVRAAAAACPTDVTVTVDAGAHFLAIMPFWPVARANGLLISNGLATMGFALPAAIGAALARPGSPVLCLVGDGGLGMTLAELETLARLDLPVAVVVFNDSALSLIEIKQRDGHGGPGAVRYRDTDFAAIAAAVGMRSTAASSATELSAALSGGWDRPLLIDAAVDPAQYSHLIGVTRG